MRRRTLIAVPISVAILLLATNMSAQTDTEHGAQRVDPGTKLWIELKKQLISAEGPKYFEGNIKDAELPPLVGKLLSAKPTGQPSVLTLAMFGSDRPEVTLRLKDKDGKDSHMPGPMMVGSAVIFEGIGASFTQEPFMLVFDVSTDPKVTPPSGRGAAQHLSQSAPKPK
jgi:hypothetical protein